MTIPYGLTDPLTLGTLYRCMRDREHTSPEDAEKAYAEDGTFLQEDWRSELIERSGEYYMESGATKLALGSTHGTMLIVDCEVSQDHKGYKTMAVKAHRHGDANVTSIL